MFAFLVIGIGHIVEGSVVSLRFPDGLIILPYRLVILPTQLITEAQREMFLRTEGVV